MALVQGKKDDVSWVCPYCETTNRTPKDSIQGCSKCGEFRTNHKEPPPDDEMPVLTYDHPWVEDITLPGGMLVPQAGKVAVRALKQVKSKNIVLPKKSEKSAGWFIVAFPGDTKDLDQVYAQEMTIEGGETSAGETLKALVSPGDIISLTEYNAWPVDLAGKDGTHERWRVASAENVIMVIKRGTEIYDRFLEMYRAFTTESDHDMNV